MPYLNVAEVESALALAASAPYAGFTQLVPLPNLSWEGRQCNAIKIANGSDSGRPGVFFLGGIHSREWGSSDILINFVEQLEQAYSNGTGITLGAKTFLASEIKTIVDDLDIYVLPQANPDGRNYSMNNEAMWRKNRRTAAPNSGAGSCVGVDLNRNFDFLWDFQTQFAPTSTVSCSANPCDYDVYHGPSAFSEPETRNVQWLQDSFPNIGYFIDLHSYGQDILYSWGDDDNQQTDPSKNFQNPAYNNVRGILDALGQTGHAAYQEYIPPSDLPPRVGLANAFASGIKAVRGTSYLVEQSVGLYPTAGASDDYAYSRHFVDASKRNVMAYTLEWGTEFQPPYSEMQNIIAEITAGLLTFCLWVRSSTQSCVLTTDRNIFGKDEIDAMLHVSAPAKVEAAFYVVIDGFRHEELGISAATLVGVPDIKPAIAFSPALGKVIAHATSCSTAGNTLVAGPQRFTWTYTLQFDASTDFTQEILSVIMTASLPTSIGITMSAAAPITLTKQPNPYEIDGAVSWLSVDLQVCQVLNNTALPNTASVVLNAGPNDFIQRLLTQYNDPLLARAPNHPFDLDLVAHQDTAAVEIAGNIGPTPVYNFAIARVRYRALATPAPNVRVFFRLFQASTTSTEYEPSSTYASGGIGSNKIPLLGVVNGEVVSIPCFAAARVDATHPNGLNAQTDPSNVGPLGSPIPADGSGAEVQVYFGCWLDINQNVPVLPAQPASAAGPFTPVQSIQQAIKNKHQCLVAEIKLDPPEPQIAAGISPSMSDKLAQRNLNIVGVASPHLVPCTFDIKPTAAGLPANQMPDELMIDWGNVPEGTKASLYLPGLSAQDILNTANRLYSHHELVREDDHTLTCKAAGISYIPIPAGVGSNHAGLMTIDVPKTVRQGEHFKVVSRQITNAISTLPTNTTPGRHSVAHDVVQWRRVIGSFQLNIPVSTKAALLEPEQRLLSVLRWNALTIPHESRWYLVFRRYLEQIAGRVDALGGDSNEIGPTSSGNWKISAACKLCELIGSALFAGLLAALGVLTGTALVISAIVFAVLLAIVVISGMKECRPKPLRLRRMLMTGGGLGVALLAALVFCGITSAQLLPVLIALVVLLGLAFLLQILQKES